VAGESNEKDIGKRFKVLGVGFFKRHNSQSLETGSLTGFDGWIRCEPDVIYRTLFFDSYIGDRGEFIKVKILRAIGECLGARRR
jgi:hypothetical protein